MWDPSADTADTSSGGNSYVHCPDTGGETEFAIIYHGPRNPRHVPMSEQGIPEVPWCDVIPLAPFLAREVAKHVGRQRAWTGYNFRKVG